MDAATTQPAGVPVAVHKAGLPGAPPVGLTVALLVPATLPAAACGVTLIVNVALLPAAMPAGVVMVHTRSRPADCAPDDVQLEAVAPAPGAALLNAKLGGSLSLTTILVPDVRAPAALSIVS